ncbi:hypothetical protein EAG_11371 [Camponotus floridanus]|uniref:Ig-like domain-containing protein n=1 Tax=Camponotus floridanus TaxID=104421 RepID=E1ZZ40_CAMFO|nr:hypothetical protein EAG_11371 [Camponotus floridanus]
MLPTRWSTSPRPLPLLIQPPSVSHRSLADLQAPGLISASESRPIREKTWAIANGSYSHGIVTFAGFVSSGSLFANVMHVRPGRSRMRILTMPIQPENTNQILIVAWLRVDTQTILTIASHVITKNHRIAVSHSDHRTWFLHIREVRESDRGWYMCQINTDPMKSQIGYLEVKKMFRTKVVWFLEGHKMVPLCIAIREQRVGNVPTTLASRRKPLESRTLLSIPPISRCSGVRCARCVCCILYGLPSRSSPPFVPKSNWHSRDTAKLSHPICSNLIQRSGVGGGARSPRVRRPDLTLSPRFRPEVLEEHIH